MQDHLPLLQYLPAELHCSSTLYAKIFLNAPIDVQAETQEQVISKNSSSSPLSSCW
jgi:hypothetical protein